MDPMLLIPLVLLGAMLIFMWRGNKKRAAQQQTLREQMVVGSDVMTQAGIYGTIVDLDSENHVTTLEVSPGTTIRVHSSTVINIVTPPVPDDASSLTSDGLPEPTATQGQIDTTPADTDLRDDADVIERNSFDGVRPDADTTAAGATGDTAAGSDDKGDDDSTNGPLGQYRGDNTPGDNKA